MPLLFILHGWIFPGQLSCIYRVSFSALVSQSLRPLWGIYQQGISVGIERVIVNVWPVPHLCLKLKIITSQSISRVIMASVLVFTDLTSNKIPQH